MRDKVSLGTFVLLGCCRWWLLNFFYLRYRKSSTTFFLLSFFLPMFTCDFFSSNLLEFLIWTWWMCAQCRAGGTWQAAAKHKIYVFPRDDKWEANDFDMYSIFFFILFMFVCKEFNFSSINNESTFFFVSCTRRQPSKVDHWDKTMISLLPIIIQHYFDLSEIYSNKCINKSWIYAISGVGKMFECV